MKAEFDQEMDSLLRIQARREATARARSMQSGVAAGANAHLDADELSAYAEQALPAATRTYYTAHLAACAECRAQVVTLARAAGIAEQLASAHTAGAVIAAHAPTWRARLAAFFAPGAWRYAIPLIALFIVSGVVLWSMTGLRARRANDSAAPQQVAATSNKTTEPNYQHAPTEEKPAEAQATSGTMNNSANSAPATTSANANAAIDKNAPAKSAASGELLASSEPMRKQAEVHPESTPPVISKSSADSPVNLDQSAGVSQPTGVSQRAVTGLSQSNSQQVAQNVYAPPAANAAPLSEAEVARAPTPAEEKAGAGGGRARDSRRDDQLAAKERSAKREADEPRAARDEMGSTRGPQKSAPASKPQRGVDDKDKVASDEVARTESRRQPDSTTRAGRAGAADTGETRNVAGRQFRRQKSAWVDTAYRAGQATVNVKRDSEQWRALIADEPELRRIADTLGGEVVVIWRGRAYRIKQ